MSAIPFLTDIDLNLNELQNAVIHPVGALPSGVPGQILYHSNELKYYNGTAWVSLTAFPTDAMLKSDYDTGGAYTHSVDNARTVGAGKTVLTSVPAGALFTDTVYDDTALSTQVSTNTTNIASNLVKINTNISDISALETTVAGHTTTLASHATSIGTNTTNIATNTGNIGANTSDIAGNTTAISNLNTLIGDNTTDIATNATNIATNVVDIASNLTKINSNLGKINTNISNISTNTTNIGTNTSNIAANTASILLKEDKLPAGTANYVLARNASNTGYVWVSSSVGDMLKSEFAPAGIFGKVDHSILSDNSTKLAGLAASLYAQKTQVMMLDGTKTMTANMKLGNKKITGLAPGTALTDGVNLDQLNNAVAGGVVFRGGVNAGTETATSGIYSGDKLLGTHTNPLTIGDMYEVTIAGTFGTEVLKIGDVMIANKSVNAATNIQQTDWTFIESNITEATESTAGIVKLATQTEANTGTNAQYAITAKTLQGYLSHIGATKALTYTWTPANGDTKTVNTNKAVVSLEVIDDSNNVVVRVYSEINGTSFTVSMNGTPANNYIIHAIVKI